MSAKNRLSEEIIMALRKSPIKTMQMSLIIVAPVAFALYTFFSLQAKGDPFEVCLAHFGAAGVIICLPFIICSFLRGFMAISGNHPLYQLISFDLDIHKYASVQLLFFALIHTLAWGLYEALTFTELYGITGIIMLVLLFGPLVVVLPYLRNRMPGFCRKYLVPHKISAIFFLIAFTIHIPVHTASLPKVILLFILGGSLIGLLALDRFLLVCFCLYRTAMNKESRVLDDRTFKLSFNRPKNFRFKAGCYVYVSIPSIRKFESHPFSICSGEKEDQVDLVIRVTGPWTQLVHSLLGKGQTAENVYLRGPFPEKAIVGAMKSPEIAFISTGVGVTPFLSMMRSLEPSQDPKVESGIVGHLSSRSHCEFSALLDAATVASSKGIDVLLHLYYTGSENRRGDQIEQEVKKNSGWSFVRSKPLMTRAASRHFKGPALNSVATLGNQKSEQGSLRHMATSPFLEEDQFLEIFEPEPEAMDRSRTLTLSQLRPFQKDIKRASTTPQSFASASDSFTECKHSKATEKSLETEDGSCCEVGSVQVIFHTNRMDLSEVLTSSDSSFYFVGPPSIAKFLNRQCARYGRKLYFTTWS